MDSCVAVFMIQEKKLNRSPAAGFLVEEIKELMRSILLVKLAVISHDINFVSHLLVNIDLSQARTMTWSNSGPKTLLLWSIRIFYPMAH
jgi:hypothetical protein